MLRALNLHGRSGLSAASRVESSAAVARLAPGAGDDADLVLALRRGDPDAARNLFNRHAPHIERVLTRMLGYVEQERADLLHDVFVRALERIRDLQNPNALKAWLTRIAVFTTQEWIRRRRRQGPPSGPEVADAREAVSVTPEAAEAVRSFYALMDRFSAEDRSAFILRFVEGMNLNEVAEACGVSFSTARRRIRRADDRFRVLLPEYPALFERLTEKIR